MFTKALMKQVIKAIKLQYPNDKLLQADVEALEITIIANDNSSRVEKAKPEDLEYVHMLCDLYGYKSVQRLSMNLEDNSFIITGTNHNGKQETQRV